jgi:hypothetical protein
MSKDVAGQDASLVSVSQESPCITAEYMTRACRRQGGASREEVEATQDRVKLDLTRFLSSLQGSLG